MELKETRLRWVVYILAAISFVIWCASFVFSGLDVFFDIFCEIMTLVMIVDYFWVETGDWDEMKNWFKAIFMK